MLDPNNELGSMTGLVGRLWGWGPRTMPVSTEYSSTRGSRASVIRTVLRVLCTVPSPFPMLFLCRNIRWFDCKALLFSRIPFERGVQVQCFPPEDSLGPIDRDPLLVSMQGQLQHNVHYSRAVEQVDDYISQLKMEYTCILGIYLFDSSPWRIP